MAAAGAERQERRWLVLPYVREAVLAAVRAGRMPDIRRDDGSSELFAPGPADDLAIVLSRPGPQGEGRQIDIVDEEAFRELMQLKSIPKPWKNGDTFASSDGTSVRSLRSSESYWLNRMDLSDPDLKHIKLRCTSCRRRGDIDRIPVRKLVQELELALREGRTDLWLGHDRKFSRRLPG